MRPLLMVLSVLIGACSLTDAIGPDTTFTSGEVTTTPAVAVTTTSATPPEETIPDPEEPDTTPAGQPVDALVTPTGVVVAVLEETANGFLVRAPCGDEATISGGTPVGEIKVVVDPGHGGENDTGAVGPNGLAESELNLEVSHALEAKLIVRGIPVILSRTADYGSTIGARAGLADHLDADVLLSVHHNAPTLGLSARPGAEVFVQHDSDDSRRLGGLVWEHLVEDLSRFDIRWSAANDAGVLSVLNSRGTDAYGMIRIPRTVSVLAELGYISNRPEAELFTTDAYVDVASKALADAVEAYLTTDQPGDGFVPEGRVFNPRPGIDGDACQPPDLE